MHKLMLLFRRPPDIAAFETSWSEEFVARAERMPGLRRVAVTRIQGAAEGTTDLHMVHEFFFDDREALRAAMASPEGQEAGRALMSFASGGVEILFAEHLEEARPAPTAGAHASSPE